MAIFRSSSMMRMFFSVQVDLLVTERWRAFPKSVMWINSRSTLPGNFSMSNGFSNRSMIPRMCCLSMGLSCARAREMGRALPAAATASDRLAGDFATAWQAAVA